MDDLLSSTPNDEQILAWVDRLIYLQMSWLELKYEDREKWSYQNSLFFCVSMVTTIGFLKCSADSMPLSFLGGLTFTKTTFIVCPLFLELLML